MRTYYEVLGVENDVEQERIREAYREKVKEYHPDVSEHPDAEERFKEVKRAEVVLSDPEERARYDRLGHDRYVDDAPFAAESAGDGDVRDAASRAAATEHDPGGRSAGWRERERRAYAEARDYWADTGTGPFDDGGVGTAASGSGAGSGFRDDPFAEPSSSSAPTDDGWSAGDPFADAPSGGVTDAGSDPDPGSAGDVPSDPPPGYAAADGWGGATATGSAHSVTDWAVEEPEPGIRRPDWTQDDVVLLASTILLYPILLYVTVLPLLPVVGNLVVGAVTLTLVAFLLPRPAFAVPVFGTWSVLLPIGLFALGISLFSTAGLVVLIGAWLPLAYSLAVARILSW